MKSYLFLAKHNITFQRVAWVIPSTYFTKAITLKEEYFTDYDDMIKFLTEHRYWWDKLPFIHRQYCCN